MPDRRGDSLGAQTTTTQAIQNIIYYPVYEFLNRRISRHRYKRAEEREEKKKGGVGWGKWKTTLKQNFDICFHQ